MQILSTIRQKMFSLQFLLLSAICVSTSCLHNQVGPDVQQTNREPKLADVREVARKQFEARSEQERIQSLSDLLVLSDHGKGTEIAAEIIRQATARHLEKPGLYIVGLMRWGIVTAEEAFAAAAPMLNSEDPELKDAAEGTIEVILALRCSNLDDSDIARFLKSHSIDQNQKLTELMSSEQRLRVMTDSELMPAQEGIKLRWAGHLIEEVCWRETNGFGDKLPTDKAAAIEQLRMLAARPEWWARYYAAAMIQKCKSLADPATVETLGNDGDARVQAVMGRTKGRTKGDANR